MERVVRGRPEEEGDEISSGSKEEHHKGGMFTIMLHHWAGWQRLP